MESRRFESVPLYDERPPPEDDGSRGGMDAFEEESIKSASSLKISFSIRSTFWHRRTLSSVRTMTTPRPITKTGAMAHAGKCIRHSPARINTTGHLRSFGKTPLPHTGPGRDPGSIFTPLRQRVEPMIPLKVPLSPLEPQLYNWGRPLRTSSGREAPGGTSDAIC